jgi:hypothetical protein
VAGIDKWVFFLIFFHKKKTSCLFPVSSGGFLKNRGIHRSGNPENIEHPKAQQFYLWICKLKVIQNTTSNPFLVQKGLE